MLYHSLDHAIQWVLVTKNILIEEQWSKSKSITNQGQRQFVVSKKSPNILLPAVGFIPEIKIPVVDGGN